MREMLELLGRRPRLLRLWLASVVSLGGDWLSYVALSVLAVQQGSGAMAVALVLVAHNVPQALLAPVAGPLADRIDRRTMMIASNLAQAILTAAMAAAALGGAIALLEVLLFLRFGATAFFTPAESAALPDTVERDELHLANTLNGATWSVVFAIGVAVGGALVAVVGPTAALLADAATFIFASVILAGLPRLPPSSPTARSSPAAGSAELSTAWRHAWARPSLLEAVLAKTPHALATGAAWVVLAESAVELDLFGAAVERLSGTWPTGHTSSAPGEGVGSEPASLGVLHAIRATGTGLGPALIAWVVLPFAGPAAAARLVVTSRVRNRPPEGKRGGPTDRLPARLAGASIATAAGVLLIAAGGGPAILVAAVFLWGAGTGSNWVESSARLQAEAPRHLLGRLSAIDLLAYSLGASVSALAGALVIDVFGARAEAALFGLALGGGASLWLRSRVRRAPALARTPSPSAERLR